MIIAFGFASIVLALLADPILAPDLSAVYHWSGSGEALFGPLVLFIFLLWALLSLLLLSARESGRWRLAVWSGLLLPAPWVIFRIVVLHWGTRLSPWIQMPRIATAAVAWILILLFWRPVHSRQSERLIGLAASVLACLGVSGSVLLCLLLHSWWEVRSLNKPLPLLKSRATAVSGDRPPRVICIILDELSYDQVFEHRFPGLQLPAFDAFAAQSTTFTHVLPAGNQTDEVIPALFTGRAISKIASTPKGGLLLVDPQDGKWSAFPQHATVFQDALNDGYQTGIVGWYNPYCRIMPGVLFHCVWSDSTRLIDGIQAGDTPGSNLVGILDVLLGNATLGKLFGLKLSQPDRLKSGQILDFQHLVAAGDSLLADPSADFVLLHMPFPHPPGFYNRLTGVVTAGDRSYIDNLALADRYLAHIRKLLEERGEWDSSTVLVMGDHSWRTDLIWKHAGYWSKEEDQASHGGRFDDRPAYLLKLSHQQASQRIDQPFKALETRRLLDAVLAGRMKTTQDLQKWLRQSR